MSLRGVRVRGDEFRGMENVYKGVIENEGEKGKLVLEKKVEE